MVEDISCNGAHDGSVTFDLSGGTPEYYLMGEDVSTAQLGPGSYVFVWSDSRGCVALVSASLDEPAPLSLQVSTSSDLDDSSSGEVLCEVSGGTLPYAFASGYWSNLDAGAYEALVSDSLQCEVFGEVFVGTPTGMLVTESPVFRVYPNPVRKEEQLAIEMSAYVHEYLLYDMYGVLVCRFNPTLNGFTLDMSGISPGQYMLVGLAGANSICEMIVVLD
jgi:hypothetical protein